MSPTHLNSQEQESWVARTWQLSTPGSLEPVEALRRENDQLRTALVTRIVIEQAKGMLAERFDRDVDEAFERLRREARNGRMKLHVLAAAVIAREAWTEAIFPSGAPSNAAALRTENRLSCSPPAAVRVSPDVMSGDRAEHLRHSKGVHVPRAARKARNQALFRQVNERIAEVASRFDPDGKAPTFICECSRLGCYELVDLPMKAYARVRDDPTTFLIVRGHEDPQREAVLSAHDGYLIVRNSALAELVKRDTD